jgi:transcriptional regulator with XRE-family HTH domain
MDDDVAESIDRAMEPLYRARLREMVTRAIEALGRVISQSELERKLGMAQGYLTKLKNGHRSPSPEIALQLAMLARQPAKRLKEIDDIWRHVP